MVKAGWRVKLVPVWVAVHLTELCGVKNTFPSHLGAPTPDHSTEDNRNISLTALESEDDNRV